MPFDGKTFKPDLTVPTLEGLSWLLRHKDAWPTRFKWNYAKCDNCAIGLAARLWVRKGEEYEGEPWAQRTFKLPGFVSYGIFIQLGAKHGARENVTPEHVADAIDKYLAKQS